MLASGLITLLRSLLTGPIWVIWIYIYIEVEFCLQLYVVAKSHEPQSTGAQGGMEGSEKNGSY